MKPKKKKKIDIKGFFVLHIEKIVLVLVIPLALYFAYTGTQHVPLPWQPDALAKSADESQQFILTNQRKAADEGIAVFTYDQYAEWIKKELKVDLYRTDTQWLPSLFPEKSKRGAVPVYTALDLKASSGLGAIAINAGGEAAVVSGLAAQAGAGANAGSAQSATANQIGARWALVTGLIPIKEQLNVYVNAFSDSVMPDPMRDMPTYIAYEVERAEIEPGKGTNDLKWEKQNWLQEYKINLGLWSGVGQDVVDPNYLAPPVSIPMAYPLPPVAKPYGAEVAHLPDIPVLTDSQTQELKQMEAYQQALLKKNYEVDEAQLLQNPFAGRSGGTPLGGGMEASMGPGGAAGGGTTGGQLSKEEEEAIFKPVEVTHYLFRYLDFKVEPGKTYRYRVRLHLANPNFELAPNFIETEALAQDATLITEVSEPSTMVTIPLESRILASEVLAANSPWGDPTTNIAAIYFDEKDGSEWYVDQDRVSRGTTVNMKQKSVTNPLIAGQTGESSPAESGGGGTGRRRPRPPRGGAVEAESANKKNVNIISDVTILDMSGGLTLQGASNVRSPGKVLVLEPSGSMVIRSVKADKFEIDGIKNPTAVASGAGMRMGSERPGGLEMP